MLTGFIIGMLTMYFTINLLFASIGMNATPTQFTDVRRGAWRNFWIDMFIGVWLVSILYKIVCLSKWNLIISQEIERRKKKDGE